MAGSLRRPHSTRWSAIQIFRDPGYPKLSCKYNTRANPALGICQGVLCDRSCHPMEGVRGYCLTDIVRGQLLGGSEALPPRTLCCESGHGLALQKNTFNPSIRVVPTFTSQPPPPESQGHWPPLKWSLGLFDLPSRTKDLRECKPSTNIKAPPNIPPI